MNYENELHAIENILNGNIKSYNKEAAEHIYDCLINDKKEVIKKIKANEKRKLLETMPNFKTLVLSFLISFGLSTFYGAFALLGEWPFNSSNVLMLIRFTINSIFPLLIINSQILEYLYQRKIINKKAKETYNNMVKFFAKRDNKLNLNVSLNNNIVDNFLQEIYLTIKDIQNNSYKTAKMELQELQVLALEYIDYKNQNKEVVDLTLTNQKEKFENRLKLIKEKVKTNQKNYKIENVLRVIDKLIKGEKVEELKEEEQVIKLDFLSDSDKGYNDLDEIDKLTSNEISYEKLAIKYSKLVKIYNRMKKHRLKYTLWSYLHNSKGIDTLLFALVFAVVNPLLVINPFLTGINGNIILSALLAFVSTYIAPMFYLGSKCLKNDLSILKGYIEQSERYQRGQKDTESLLKTDKERDRDKGLEQIASHFKNKKVDSFIKDLYYDIELIKAHPYEDCEKDIIDLNTIANDYALYMYNHSDNPTLKINQGIYDFYKKQYEIEYHMMQKQNQVKDIVEINRALKDALNNPETDNFLINNDIFIKDIIKVINAIKANNYPYSNNELQEVRGILVNYLNWRFVEYHTYEEINREMKKYYYQLNNVIFKVKNKQVISDNIKDINNVMKLTLQDGVELDANLGLDVNKLELKLK